MTSSIEAVRAALAAGPAKGKWARSAWADVMVGKFRLCQVNSAMHLGITADVEQAKVNAAFIAACNPVAIADLLATLDAAIRERDELRGDAERYRAIRREMHADNPRLMVVQDYFGDCGIFPAEELDAEVDALITAQNETAADEAARSTGGDGGGV